MSVKQAAPWFLLLYYTVAGWPGGYTPIASGLDDSWMYGLNALFHAGPVFGTEVAFTFGPLGFLAHPKAVDGNLARGLAFWLTLHLAGVALLAFALRLGRVWQACGMMTLVILAQSLEVWPEYWATLNVGLFVLSALLLPGPGWVWAAAAGLLTGILGGFKLTSGAAALAIILLALAATPAPPGRRRRTAALIACGVALVWLPLYFSFFKGPAAFIRWLRWSSELTSGYSAAMSVIFQPETLWNASAVAAAYALFLLAAGSRQRRLALVFLPLLFIAFRHGYVRQGTHSIAFYGSACAVPALLFFFTADRRERAAVLGLAGICAAVMTYHCNRPGSGLQRSLPKMRDYLSARTGFDHIGRTLHLQQETRRLEQIGQGLASAAGPPGPWREAIHSDFGRVAGLPWEITSLSANGMAWQLLPSLQFYAAYTQELDRATAAVFTAPERPKWIWLMNVEIDGRAQITDNPETWIALLDHYRVAAYNDSINQLLLRAKPDATATRTGPVVRQSTVKPAQWVEIEDLSRLWRVQVRLKPALWGRLARYVYQWPAAWMEVQRTRGAPWKIRILPDTAAAGLLMPLVPASPQEIAAAFENRLDNPVRRFRILLPEGGYFQPAIDLSWRRTSRVFAGPQP